MILGSHPDDPYSALVLAPVLGTLSEMIQAGLFPYDEAYGGDSGMEGGVAAQGSSLT